MRAAGIITEYNPFHNGHMHHIREALRLSECDCLICVMSGNFVQRGEPAIFDKFLRAGTALSCGVNIVVELPVRFSVSSGENFAKGAVDILSVLNADTLVFGSEFADPHSFSVMDNIARLLSDEPYEYKSFLREELSRGSSFPKAREYALTRYFSIHNDATDSETISKILKSPNCILSIEYMKAVKKSNCDIKPMAVQRTLNNYNDISITEYSSATALRNAIKEGKDISSLLSPEITDAMSEFGRLYPIFAQDMTHLLNYRLATLINENVPLDAFLDIDTKLANRIARNFTGTLSFEELIYSLKTKDVTYAKISRALTHILLGIRNDMPDDCGYIRLLGLDSTGRKYLNDIKKSTSVPIITKTADAARVLDSSWIKTFSQDIFASDIYNQLLFTKYGIAQKSDYKTSPIIRF